MKCPAHIRFGGAIDDGKRPMQCHRPIHQCPIVEIAMHEHVRGLRWSDPTRVALQITGVGEPIQVNDCFVRLGQPVQHVVADDES